MQDKNFLEPEITLTGECHTCGEPIIYGREHCLNCGIEIDHDELAPSVINHFVITQACSAANSIRTFDVAVFIFLGHAILRAVIQSILNYPLWIDILASAFWVLPVLTITRWFRRHGNWDSQDQDYLFARKEMKSALWLWVAANIINGIVIWIGRAMASS